MDINVQLIHFHREFSSLITGTAVFPRVSMGSPQAKDISKLSNMILINCFVLFILRCWVTGRSQTPC